MKLFVTGGTGVIGRPALAGLVAAGHEVRAVARGSAKAELVRSLGAAPVEVDLFDPAAVADAVAGSEGIVHLATNIPPARAAWRVGAWAVNDRLRREVTQSLVDAARTHGVRRIVKESLAFVYPDSGDRLIDEDVPPVEDNPVQASVFESERMIEKFAADGGVGVILRFGMFYGPDASTTDDALSFAKRRVAWPMIGDGAHYFPAVHSDDAASAVVAALTAPSGIYNVAGTTVTKREQADAFAAAFGLKHLRIIPETPVRLGSRGKMSFVLRSQRVSSQRFTDATGWRPAHPDVEEGWRAVATARKDAGHG